MKDLSYVINKEDAPEVDDLVILQHITWRVIKIVPVWNISVSPNPSKEYVRVHVQRAIDIE